MSGLGDQPQLGFVERLIGRHRVSGFNKNSL
jgi:hypothetical protein